MSAKRFGDRPPGLWRRCRAAVGSSDAGLLNRQALLSRTRELEHRDGRILLAGADIASGSYALIDGAIDTGIVAGRTAADICLNP